jgi:hypothetical protein
MDWNLNVKIKCGTETALDACDYFVDEVDDPFRKPGEYCIEKRKGNLSGLKKSN